MSDLHSIGNPTSGPVGLRELWALVVGAVAEEMQFILIAKNADSTFTVTVWKDVDHKIKSITRKEAQELLAAVAWLVSGQTTSPESGGTGWFAAETSRSGPEAWRVYATLSRNEESLCLLQLVGPRSGCCPT